MPRALKMVLGSLKWLFLCLGAIVVIFPLFWTISTSFKPVSELMTDPPIFWPRSPVGFANYAEVLRTTPMGQFYLNSILVTLAITLGDLFTSSLAGYILEKFEFRGREAIFLAIISTMMVPFHVKVIPLYLLMRDLHLLNNLGGLIIPGVVSAFGIFLMRQFMKSIPNELLDAARIDGASEFEIYWRIALPLCIPALSALGIFVFMSNWDSLFWPLLIIEDEAKQTLPLGLSIFKWVQYGPLTTHLLSAGAVMAIVPPLVVFLVAQRRFIEGIALTGLKS